MGSLIPLPRMVMTHIYMVPFISSDLGEHSELPLYSAPKHAHQEAKGWHRYLCRFYFRGEELTCNRTFRCWGNEFRREKEKVATAYFQSWPLVSLSWSTTSTHIVSEEPIMPPVALASSPQLPSFHTASLSGAYHKRRWMCSRKLWQTDIGVQVLLKTFSPDALGCQK